MQPNKTRKWNRCLSRCDGSLESTAVTKRYYEILEFLVKHDRSEPLVALLFAVNMLVNTEEGDTFSSEEISGWLPKAGFRKPRLLNVPAVSPLVIATKA